MENLNRYYVVDLSGNPNRARQIRDRFARLAGLRDQTHEVLQFERRSLDGTKAIAQVALSDADHAFLIGLSWVEYIGDFDPATGQASQSVHDYLAANAAEWSAPTGGTTHPPGVG